LKKNDPDYEEVYGFAYDLVNNRTVIEDFGGEIDCKRMPVETDYHDDTETVIIGTGNINFRSCNDEDPLR
jgi:hypothetical protein